MKVLLHLPFCATGAGMLRIAVQQALKCSAPAPAPLRTHQFSVTGAGNLDSHLFFYALLCSNAIQAAATLAHIIW